MKKDIFKWSDTKLYLIIIGLMVVIIAIYEPKLGFIGALLLAYLVYYDFRKTSEKKRELTKYIEDLSNEFDSATKHAIFNMPFPLVIIDKNGAITWYNTPFLEMMVEEDLLNERIYELIPNFKLAELLEAGDDTPINIKYGDNYYKVYSNTIDTKKVSNRNKIILLYWVDNTEYVKLEAKYKGENTVIGLIYVDNYDEVKGSTPDINKPLVLAEIDKRIASYFTRYGGLVRKYENDKYLVIMNYFALESIKSKKFDILDQMKELNIGNTIPITLSMGVCATENNIIESYDNAKGAIDIALGRGGDQAVLKSGPSFEYFGGKSKALEKRNKVKSRVIAYALRQLIDQAENVFVMGHKNPDMDSFGSGIGILRAIDNRNKEGYLVLNGENPSIKNIYDKLRKEQPDLLEKIITTEEALEIINKDSLLIVVDNHKPSFTEAPELLDIADKAVVIDHHRRGTEFVKDPVLTYLEPYASSASELVTEVLSYMSEDLNLTKFEAEALLAGITVDTKNFSYQTGVRTFEAASILKRVGADTTTVRQLFRDNFNTFISKAEVIQSTRLILDRIAIGKLDKEMEDSVLIAAQAADELLDINGVEASFVLTRVNDRIHISGRSLGDISVQLILERLGGGGHLTSAGTQISGMSMEEAEEMLIDKIEEFLEEGEKK
ncbi:DHH family phosphoesterase [Paratissierella segnis]|jgi:c-di-AMP phosphodiesterase-like protein|uniref:Cyclic-di-AMP phosphodiesterase n=1 Tax=Paratissierella segnis TaxID=2763679 RepID=A0A926IEG6_9FIRM|nr:DHH family phosphoesterase [Paratissierella segnis]MBC8587352.1 DHH family phosphoesterase [Paratissierella segnis]